jgi:MYXO-CTERM domain-containing protein
VRPRLLCFGLALATSLGSASAWAGAKFTIKVVDAAGVGFNDKTAATPVAGNTGTTVGQQRLNAFQAAGDAWGRILESSVPIVVEASFPVLECMNGMAVLGQASAYSVANVAGLPTKGSYPKALANKIVGKETSPGQADIVSEFNSGLNDCLGIDWYYGLDGNATADQANLLTTVIHELAHGLGFSDDTDPSTGAFASSAVPFATFMLDNKTGKHFSDMTNAERKAALTDVRGLAWDGKRTDAVGARFLAKGNPSVQISPSASGYTGFIGEANFGPLAADGATITGEVAAGTLASSCTSVSGSFSGKIALVTSPTTCASLNATMLVEKAGGLGLLFAYNQTGSPPPVALEFRKSDVAKYPTKIPTLAVTLSDANAIKSASGATVSISADQSKSVGADGAGHALLFASNPIQSGSTGSHWDPLVRPSLIMEPVDLPNPILYLDMERAVLWDIGWTGSCGNGTMDAQEECDDGANNSDYFADSCRLNCTKARCGDGIVDTDEQCDPGGNGTLGDSNCDSSCHSKSGGAGGARGSGGVSGKGGAGGLSAGGASGSGGVSGKGGAGGTGGAGGAGGVSGSGGSSARGGAGGAFTGGSGGTGTGGTGGSGGSSAGGGTSGGAGQGGSQTGSGGQTTKGSPGSKSSGCSCRVDRGGFPAGTPMMMVAGLGLALWLRRRRRGEL